MLDRILISFLEKFYPKMVMQVLTREISDHSPLLLDFGLQQRETF
jgi:endonuclease/exonuclease/phosphatase family metal-dependent hydrolase